MKLSLIFFLLCFTSSSFAVDIDIANKILANSDSGPQVRELNWLNINFMDRQRKSIQGLTSAHYGRFIKGDKSDLALLQRLVDDSVIAQDNIEQLQALGVILGDVFAHEHESLSWVIYEDDLAATQAVCAGESKNCLFPITMLSRRMEVGLKPNISALYQSAIDDMKPYLPKLPYAVQ
jgi:hypothetical protein